ncbi:MAG TPA: hypothetical protein PL124_08065 [Candidatus Cloacimonadota bacterium]|nr:hypothetical protein [Candidatus Cloacimonadota bacterium]HPS39349.1 hypothetical protein [Candidatus Cloacimonadota bacterium]
MKKALTLVLILIPLWLAAQDMPFMVRAKTRYSTSGMIGYETINGEKYYQFRVIPEFHFWKIKLGLDLDFLADMDYHLWTEDWDDLSDLLSKVYYVRFAKKEDPFYVQAGGFPGLTVGNGLIMQNYSNMALYPELRNTGLMLGGNPPLPTHPGLELFTSDLKKNEILSLSGRFQPLPDSTLSFLSNLVLGFSVVTDRNQYGNLRSLVSDSLFASLDGLGKKPVTVYGVAYTLPVYRKDKLTIGQYAEFAHISGNGSGVILPGIYADLGVLKVNLEYRLYGKRFLPAFFDENYEEERAFQPDDSTAVWLTKEEYLHDVKPAQGFNGSIEATFFDRIKTTFAWQNMYGKDLHNGRSIWLKLWVDTQYKRLENFSLAYSKLNTGSMAINGVIEPNAEIKAAVTFRVWKKKWYVIARYTEKYRERDNNGVINWLKETKRSAGMGLKCLY